MGCHCVKSRENKSTLDLETEETNRHRSKNENNLANINGNGKICESGDKYKDAIVTPNGKVKAVNAFNNTKNETSAFNNKLNEHDDVNDDGSSVYEDAISIKDKTEFDSNNIVISENDKDLNKAKELFDLINQIRTDPKRIRDTLFELTKYIKPNSFSDDGPAFLFEYGSMIVGLKTGEEAFLNLIKILDSTGPLSQLEFKEELCIEIPKKNTEFFKKELIIELIQKKKEELENVYNEFKFHYDLGSMEPKMSLLMQLLDDNAFFKGKRRENILSPDLKYVGVSQVNDEHYKDVYYLFFATKE